MNIHLPGTSFQAWLWLRWSHRGKRTNEENIYSTIHVATSVTFCVDFPWIVMTDAESAQI